MSTKLFERAAAAIELATKGQAATDTVSMNVGDLCVILGLLRSFSSQSLSLSEARAENDRKDAEIERLKGLVAGIRECPQEGWQATPERITQKYLRRYPASKMSRSWAGCMVHISTEHGVWRINGEGYTRAGKFDAWVLPFEEAQSRVAHCGPEKEAAFIKVVQPIGSGRTLADATTNPPEPDLSSLRKGAEVAARILDAEADFARENLEAITDDEAAHPGNNVPVRTVWRDRKVIAERCAAAIRALVSGSREEQS